LATDACNNLPDDAICDNGLFCDGSETCDVVNDCQDGSPQCTEPLLACDEDLDECVPTLCNKNGVCEGGEDCNNCAEDCISGTTPGADCGNGICEASNGENGVTCPADCASKLNGKPQDRFSCGFGDGYAPEGCGGDSRCVTDGFDCTEVPVEPGAYCCGDAICEGAEDGFTCEVDCGLAPFCGDGSINLPGEQCDGADLGGQTCFSQGFDSGTLACTGTCQFDTTGCEGSSCGLPGASCSANSECCSNKCKGKPGSQTCQ
jgi:hypothetical protein